MALPYEWSAGFLPGSVEDKSKLRAFERFHSPYFGEMVGFNWVACIHELDAPLREWLEANIEGSHGVDYQRRNYRVSFLRPADADLCYLAFR